MMIDSLGDKDETDEIAETTVRMLETTRTEHPIDGDDVDEWVDRFTSLNELVATIRESDDPSLLTENEAEVLVRWHAMSQSATEIAEAMDEISDARVYQLRQAAEERLLAADATLTLIHNLCEQIAPKTGETADMDVFNRYQRNKSEGE